MVTKVYKITSNPGHGAAMFRDIVAPMAAEFGMTLGVISEGETTNQIS